MSVHPGVRLYGKSIGEGLDWEFFDNHIDCVCHLAGESVIGQSVSEPDVFFHGNVISGIRLLDAMVEIGCTNIVYSSTASVYGNPQYDPIDERHPTNPINAYGESKLMFEKVLEWYRRAYGLHYCTLRYFNVGGATSRHGEHRKNETRLVPTAIDAIAHGRPISIFGNDWNTPDGTCQRDYVHVKDIADAHLLAIEHLSNNDHGIYNLGGERAYSVLEIVHELVGIMGKGTRCVFTGRRPGDPEKLLASSELAKKELGWQPRFSDLHTILEDSYRWYRELHGNA